MSVLGEHAPEVIDVQAVDISTLANPMRAQVAVHVVPIHQLGSARGGRHSPPMRPDPGRHSRAHKGLAELLVVVVGAGRPDALQIPAVFPIVLDQFLWLPEPLVRRPLEVRLRDQLDPIWVQQLD